MTAACSTRRLCCCYGEVSASTTMQSFALTPTGLLEKCAVLQTRRRSANGSFPLSTHSVRLVCSQQVDLFLGAGDSLGNLLKPHTLKQVHAVLVPKGGTAVSGCSEQPSQRTTITTTTISRDVQWPEGEQWLRNFFAKDVNRFW